MKQTSAIKLAVILAAACLLPALARAADAEPLDGRMVDAAALLPMLDQARRGRLLVVQGLLLGGPIR